MLGRMAVSPGPRRQHAGRVRSNMPATWRLVPGAGGRGPGSSARGAVVYLGEVAPALGISKAFASRLIAQAMLADKSRNLGYQQGWTAAHPRA